MMMIFGVAYHVVSRFTAVPLYSRRAARWHWWIANVGLVLMVIGFAMRAMGLGAVAASTAILAVRGTVGAIGAYLFAYNLWRTLDGTPFHPVAVRR